MQVDQVKEISKPKNVQIQLHFRGKTTCIQEELAEISNNKSSKEDSSDQPAGYRKRALIFGKVFLLYVLSNLHRY